MAKEGSLLLYQLHLHWRKRRKLISLQVHTISLDSKHNYDKPPLAHVITSELSITPETLCVTAYKV